MKLVDLNVDCLNKIVFYLSLKDKIKFKSVCKLTLCIYFVYNKNNQEKIIYDMYKINKNNLNFLENNLNKNINFFNFIHKIKYNTIINKQINYLKKIEKFTYSLLLKHHCKNYMIQFLTDNLYDKIYNLIKKNKRYNLNSLMFLVHPKLLKINKFSKCFPIEFNIYDSYYYFTYQFKLNCINLLNLWLKEIMNFDSDFVKEKINKIKDINYNIFVFQYDNVLKQYINQDIYSRYYTEIDKTLLKKGRIKIFIYIRFTW